MIPAITLSHLKRALITGFALLCIPGTPHLRAQRFSGVDSTLHAIQMLYDAGEYLNAELEARRYLERPALPDSLQVLAEQWIAFSLVAQGKSGPAADHFAIILRMDSSYTLDPVLTSPKIRQALDAARGRNIAVVPHGRPETPVIDAPAGASPSFRLLLFPGWDQLHQGKETKGYILLFTGALSAGAAVTFDVLRRSARDDYLAAGTPQDAMSTYETYDRYVKAEYYSVAVFALLYLYSAFDAFFDLPPSFEPAATGTPFGPALGVRWTF